jgi:hypothetical protein
VSTRERRFRVTVVWETPPEARTGLIPYAVTSGKARFDVVTRWPGDTIATLETEALVLLHVRREDCSVLSVEELEPASADPNVVPTTVEFERGAEWGRICLHCKTPTTRIAEPDGYDMPSCSPACDVPILARLDESLRKI